MSETTISHVHFGTSGHRGIIGKTFTNDHVKAIAVGIANLFSNDNQPTLIIGFDPREGNDINYKKGSFTHTLITNLNNLGVHTLSFDNYIPTPVISWAIQHFDADGGIILTASHNPPNYNGIKYNPKNGAPACEKTTQKIELVANNYLNNPYPLTSNKQGVHTKEKAPFQAFCKYLKTSCTLLGLEIPKTFTKPLLVDVKHGACGALWEYLGKELKLDIQLNHREPRSDFGNIEPNPTKYEHLDTAPPSYYGSAGNDPDGDRHALKDETGAVITPETLTTIIIDYLCTIQKKPQQLATTLASSQLLKTLCQKQAITFHETCVGFKYFTPFFEQAKQNQQTCIGIESSGGFSVAHHTFEKCGFLPILCLIIISEQTKKPLSLLKETIEITYGKQYFKEAEFLFNDNQKTFLQHYLQTTPKKTLEKTFDVSIDAMDSRDGLKLMMGDSWLLCRLSGTEPIARIYSESPNETKAANLNTNFHKTLTRIIESI